MAEFDIPDFNINLFGVVGSWQYELPSGDSIGAIVFEGGPNVQTDFYIVIQKRGGFSKQINKLHPEWHCQMYTKGQDAEEKEEWIPFTIGKKNGQISVYQEQRYFGMEPAYDTYFIFPWTTNK